MGTKKLGNIITQRRMIYLAAVVASILFGMAFMITPVLKENSEASLLYGNFFIGVLLYLGILSLFCLISQNEFRNSQAEISPNKIFVICFSAVLIVGIGYLIVYYPGTGMYDTLAILKSEGFGFAIQHPWFYLLVVQWTVKVVFLLGGDYEVSLVILSIMQILMTAGVYSYCLTWLYKRKLNSIIWVLMAIAYILCPFFGLTMVNLFKDVPFSLLMLVWMPVLFEIYESGGENLSNKNTYVKIFFCFLFSLLRNNGVYISFFILLGILFVNLKKWKCQVLYWIMLIAVIFGSQAVEKANGVVHLYKETVAIPLQQMAAVVYYDGNITVDQEEFIDKIIDLDFIKENYNPYSATNLKWGGESAG